MLRTPGAAGQAALISDSFDTLAFSQDLSTRQAAGAVWSRASGVLGAKGDPGAPVNGEVSPLNAARFDAAGATGWYTLGSGLLLTDVQAGIQIRTVSAMASGAEFSWYAKGIAVGSQAVWTRLVLGPSANHSLALMSFDGSATVLHASAGLGGSTASGLYLGQAHNLVLRTIGGRADVWLATGVLPASPILTASHTNLAMGGNPALRAQAGGGATGIRLDNVLVSTAGGSAPDTDAREYFRFESDPQPRAVQGNASVFKQDMARYFRGLHPKLPPVGSPGATAPARMVVFTGQIDDFIGNDIFDVRVDARERFTILR